MRIWVAATQWLSRTIVILLLVMIGTTMLVRYAPGYLTDEREMEAPYAPAARAELSVEAMQSRSLGQMISSEIESLAHGGGGISRQYGVPVSQLILPRLAVSGLLLLRSLLLAWILAVCGALAAGTGRYRSLACRAPATLLLAIPTAALATLCLISDHGGPVFVMALLLAARDFKFLERTLRKSWLEPHLLHARAQGISITRLLWFHVLPDIAPQLTALVPLSLVTALSALVPVEVIFNAQGLGQLAWNAAMNRDLPVLLAATMVIALAVALSGSPPSHRDRAADQSADEAAEWTRT
jgi:peptide/nickel transport system permease protein